MKEVHVAVGVVRRGETVLIARRPDHVHQGGLLEFPGGKVEPGERVQDALVRELREEVGIDVCPSSLHPVIGIRHDYGDKRVFLDVWEANVFSGEPVGREGQYVDWLPATALKPTDFPKANRPIIQAVQLPKELPISGGQGLSAVELYDVVCARLETCRPRWFLLRAPWLSESEYIALAARLQTYCDNAGVRMMLHGHPDLMRAVPAAGVHIPSVIAREVRARPLASTALLGVSCHNDVELEQAAALDADYAVLGPVARTASHPDAEPMGWRSFATLAATAKLPVYALGGLSVNDTEQALASGAQGVAGIGYWWQC
ncbi:Nudix family hydrolase [Marinobacter sp. 1Y8]